MATLQDKLSRKFGEDPIKARPIPQHITSNLNPKKPLRPYQEFALKLFLTYFEKDFVGKETQPDLLFQMATGSGKTLMMAATMLHLYEKGYRNFLFFVYSTNIVVKTTDNFTNPTSGKYLFGNDITIGDKRVEIKIVDNFQNASPNCINLCLTTTQKLHYDLTFPKEGCLTFDDFASFETVLIADESHHNNATTRSGNSREEEENWEKTVQRVFKSNVNNVMLEFTATAEIDNNTNLAEKYESKLIFDYPLKQFRLDGYSKEVVTEQNGNNVFDRVLSAIVLSQFKLKLLESIGCPIKPIILFKSKSIPDNKSFFDFFRQRMGGLTPTDLLQLESYAKDEVKKAFDYFKENNISMENLTFEIKEDFSDEKLIILDNKNISEINQSRLNNLESDNNIFRAVFAVNMLNEGWDVLNLFDIVRLYETKTAASTTQECQLIGRGARYLPFTIKGSSAPANQRKFDNDLSNPLRMIETLHFHSIADSEYIKKLKEELAKSGIIPPTTEEKELKLKDNFKETRLYKRGVVFVNKRKLYAPLSTTDTFTDEVLNHTFSVKLPIRKMRSDVVFDEQNPPNETSTKYFNIKLSALQPYVLRNAINSNDSYRFGKLKATFPALKSVEEFIRSEKFLAGLSVDITSEFDSLEALTQSQKLYIAQQVLHLLAPMIFNRLGTYIGTREFKPIDFQKVFKDHILQFTIDPNSNKEFGRSMRTPIKAELTMDLEVVDWYAYNDCYGTSEEKYLIKYIESMMPKLSEKYSEIYLVRNEKDLKIYAFEDGGAFEPDFILFMRLKGADDVFDNIQIFIEPKGAHIEENDKWKQDFLAQIGKDAILNFATQSDKFRIWGLPFYQEENKRKFDTELKGTLEIGN